MSGVEKLEVKDQEDGMRLDRWFKAHYPALSHGNLQKLLRTGQIRVDGARAKANTRLEAGQCLRIPPLSVGKTTEQKNSHQLSNEDERFIQSLVIYKDDDVLALNKPPGLSVQGGTKTSQHVDRLLDGLKFETDERPRLVHRLDKNTSGVLLLARTRKAATKLGEALKHHTAQKVYWALVAGVPRRGEGEIDLPIAKIGGAGKERVRPMEKGDPGAQSAITKYALVDHAGRRFSWLTMMPITGRTHQIRVHAAAIGHPIIGDGKYGGQKAHPGGDIPKQLHLHARSICLPHPSGGTLHVDAPIPSHMRKTWELLGFDAEMPANDCRIK